MHALLSVPLSVLCSVCTWGTIVFMLLLYPLLHIDAFVNFARVPSAASATQCTPLCHDGFACLHATFTLTAVSTTTHDLQVKGGPAAAVAGALRNGTDAECGIPGPWGEGYLYHEALNESLSRGLVDQATVDRAIVRKWRTAFRLGLFDPLSDSPWAHLGKEQVGGGGET